MRWASEHMLLGAAWNLPSLAVTGSHCLLSVLQDWDAFSIQSWTLIVKVYYWQHFQMPLHPSEKILECWYLALARVIQRSLCRSWGCVYLCVWLFLPVSSASSVRMSVCVCVCEWMNTDWSGDNLFSISMTGSFIKQINIFPKITPALLWPFFCFIYLFSHFLFAQTHSGLLKESAGLESWGKNRNSWQAANLTQQNVRSLF